MFALYFALSAIALLATFGLDLPSQTRLYLYFFIGLTVFGIFGSFTFYLPELFPDSVAGDRFGVFATTSVVWSPLVDRSWWVRSQQRAPVTRRSCCARCFTSASCRWSACC
jgi:hypothetical protein